MSKETKSIIELEIKNLSEKEKEELLKKHHKEIWLNPNYKTFEEFVGKENLVDTNFKDMNDPKLIIQNSMKNTIQRDHYWAHLNITENKQFLFKGDYHSHYPELGRLTGGADDIEEVLMRFFAAREDDFIDFQKSHKNSLYNQTIKKHGFKDLTYEDMAENLTPEQKKKFLGKKDIEMTLPDILERKKYLNPHYKVNQFIVENHKLKEKLTPHNQTNQLIVENQEFEEPKLKK